MKVMTILGTRPEIIRLSLLIKKLDNLCDHVLVHTGQNYAERLSDLFLSELNVRKPNYYLGVTGSFGKQIGMILEESEKLIRKEQPDKLLLLGDTNSALSAIIAKRLAIPVYHMEAGNRCFDDRVPEEVNRRIIDHSSDILMPYTHQSKNHLIKEGIDENRIFITGNPIKEVLDCFSAKINASKALSHFDLAEGNYFLVTLHRSENVDEKERLIKFLDALNQVNKLYSVPVLCSLHPRTQSKISEFNLNTGGIVMIPPQGLFDFVCLEKNARCVLTDSGTVQEECCIYKIANVTLRDVTERPETLEVGSNILSGAEPENILNAIDVALKKQGRWTPPEEYMRNNVSETVIKIILEN